MAGPDEPDETVFKQPHLLDVGCDPQGPGDAQVDPVATEALDVVPITLRREAQRHARRRAHHHLSDAWPDRADERVAGANHERACEVGWVKGAWAPQQRLRLVNDRAYG